MGIFLTNRSLSLFSLPQTGSDVTLDVGMDATTRALMEASAQSGGLTDSFESQIPTQFLSGMGASKVFGDVKNLLPIIPRGGKPTPLHESTSVPITKYPILHERMRLENGEGDYADVPRDFEESKITPEEMFSLIGQQMTRILNQYEKVKEKLEAGLCAEYLKEMEQIETRKKIGQKNWKQ